jgi:mannose-6-phosphate isomerase-like protein (cupin superfamily)
MPHQVFRASDRPAVSAPDGIPIHPIGLPPSAFVGIVEGRIPPGRHAIHLHLTLEQITYVVAGHVTAVTAVPRGAPEQVALSPGDFIVTLPGESLQFVNHDEVDARVLFICAPPYPPDDSDTRLLSAHGGAIDDHLPAALTRLAEVRAAINVALDARAAHLTGMSNERPSD